MNREEEKSSLLRGAGARVRELRNEAGLTIKELAERAELSLRFVIQLEAGQGNISIAGLARVASALNRSLPELIPHVEEDNSIRAQTWRWISRANEDDLQAFHEWLAERNGEPSPRFVALVGLRGAGKSTVGAMLAKKLKTDFVELDSQIEQAAGMSLGEIFSIHGQDYYHRLEFEALRRLFAESQGCVLATGGSIVTKAESWGLVRKRSLTVWLRATPKEHMNRVIRQGDLRPMKDNPSAMSELKALLTRREPLYAESELVIKTSDKTAAEVVAQLLQFLPW